MMPITVDEALERIAGAAVPLEAQRVGSAGAGGLYLAAEVCARTPLPPFDASAMDGYAVHSADCAEAGVRPLAFELAAGDSAAELPIGRVARIFTGAPLPRGAGSVVMQEDASFPTPDTVALPAAKLGSHIRRAGELFAAGASLAQAGQRLDPARLALCIAGGLAEFEVYRRPRLAILVTGAEVTPPGDALSGGMIFDSNGPMLEAAARAAEVAFAGRTTAPDALDALVEAATALLARSDVLLTSGGVSVGDHDLIVPLIERLGGEVLFHGVKMKPGKPLLVARVGRAWLVGLPGNPVSALCGWSVFVRPLLARLAGAPHGSCGGAVWGRLKTAADNPARRPGLESQAQRNREMGAGNGRDTGRRPALTAFGGGAATGSGPPPLSSGGRTLLLPASLADAPDGLRVSPCAWQGSHDLMALAASDAFMRIEAGASLEPGQAVRCYPHGFGGR